jgi:galactokinase
MINVRQNFIDVFNVEPQIVVKSPGRINIIGEHTDYNEGFVMPAAIDKAVYIALAKSNDDKIHLFAQDYNEPFSIAINQIKKTDTEWANYVLGVVAELQKGNHTVQGFKAVIAGDLPIGAGMSSSAAVECATAFALNEMFGFGLTRMQMAALTQKAEHNFSGVMCGIMDMFASLMGKANHAIQLDCRDLSYKHVPLDLGEYELLLFNTNVKHSLASSEYNTRRKQCEAGVAMVKAKYSSVNSLRDVSEAMLDELVKPHDTTIDKRCRFVVQEIQRLQDAATAMQQGDLLTLGKKMFATHDGLSNDYAVSCKELDFLVDAVRNNEAVLGARMMGGGFGGCTINLIHSSKVDEVVAVVSKQYETNMQLPFTMYKVKVEDGTHLI